MTIDTERKRNRLNILFYTVMALLLVWLLFSAMRDELAQTPDREATANLGQYGLITIRFQTDPFPALPTGTVMLSFMPMDSRQRPMEVDQITYEYGPAGSEQVTGSGTAKLMTDGSGMYTAGAQFPYIGNWWVNVTVSQGNAQDEVRFTIYVEPAQ